MFPIIPTLIFSTDSWLRKYTMYLYQLSFVFLFGAINTFDIPRNNNCTSDLTIDNDQYKVAGVYHIGDSFPTDTQYDKYGNLFFVEAGRSTQGYYFDGKMIKANSSTPEKISGLPDGLCYSVAVDKKNMKVYFGTGKGIYNYNYDSEDTTLISSPDLKSNNLYVDKDGNKYITQSPDGVEQLYLLSDKRKIRFKTFDALDELAVDDDNNFYFIREEKLFVLKSNLSSPIFVGNVTYDGYAQITFNKDKVFVASETLNYLHENDTGKLKQVKSAPENITAVAFDYSHNLVIGTRGKIIKYKNNETGVC
ncbi:uncharacterized protein LOC126979238 [Leptidea sinapis]|uniref:uncharacterized protein LOC126979238 n=1 Tax=Leptidea sinapis TaxID=189913 RepID=UPI0021276219|nr:uncharacterized protein LOC126979238 [Leptidea sinapis]